MAERYSGIVVPKAIPRWSAKSVSQTKTKVVVKKSCGSCS